MLPIFFISCKKEPKLAPSVVVSPAPIPVPVPTATSSELTKDSIFLYAKEVYYWNDDLPSYETFNPRKYTSGATDLSNYNQVLFNISQIKINPLTSKPFEFLTAGSSKYSYIKDKTTKNPTAYIPHQQSSVDLEGNGNDMGLSFSAIGTTSSFDVRVKYSSPGSPADKAGLERGDLVSKFNNTTVGTNFDTESSVIENAIAGNTVVLGGKKKDGTLFSITLTKSLYKSSPIYKDTVITSSGKKVGYLAYARFSNHANSEAALNQVFSKFAAANVTELVIDLRYNGGGYVSLAEHLTNLIAPSSLNGKLMFKEKFNELMQSGKATILKNQPLLDGNGKVRFSGSRMLTYLDIDYSEAENTFKFQKEGTLEGVQNVIFIITRSSASASELVINNLKPHMNVKLVGQTSYGKPIGFFPITVENRYDVYYSMFTSINSNGQTDYFAGFTPDALTKDDVTQGFGDPKELSFAAALAYLTKGSFTATTASVAKVSVKGASVSSSSVQVRDIAEDNSFKGMVETRFKLRK
ncbi:MAG TPA: S41 family peptidase [Sphingobacteriaceae bacterium]|nr:S41 family peptidase [Sphingobacteriaceae bacterium]